MVVLLGMLVGLAHSHSIKEEGDRLTTGLGLNPNRWTIVTLQYLLYRARKDGRHHRKRSVLQPVLDQYRVDLVLQGHEHYYARSGLLSYAERSLPKSRTQSHAGTVYVVSVSGPKMMEVTPQPIMQRVGAGDQLYQIISIDHRQLHYEARTATGALFDAFTLIKQHREPHPLSNQLVETLPAHSTP